MFTDDETYPPTPEADELCPMLPPEMRQDGTVWPCRVCGCEASDPQPLRKCLSETVLFAALDVPQ